MIKKKTKLLALIILVVFLAGCGMWTNFTTYFNRYYNAKEKFIEAEAVIAGEKEKLFEFRPKSSTKAKNQLEDVIEGCSKILQYNKESSYINEALFLIGKAFYYQQNYLKADRKFAELNAQGNSELYLDSKLWLSKTKLQLRNFDLGLRLINEVIDSTIISEDEEVFTDALITKTAFFIFREDYPEAIVSAEKLVEVSSSSQLKAEIVYEIGKMNLELKNNEQARKYFAMVNEFTPTFEIEVLSKLEVARLGSKLGKSEESIELLEDMRSESKYEKYFDKIDLELGIVNLELGKLDKALDILTEVDTVYDKSEASGMAKFYKGVLYEDGLGIIDSAIIYYEQTTKAKAPTELKNIAVDKGRTLKKYVQLKKEIDGYYKDYAYLADTTLFAKDSLKFAQLWYEDSLKLADQIEERNTGTDEVKQRALSAITGILDRKYKDSKPIKNSFNAGELNKKLSVAQYDMGLYFYNEIVDQDSAKFYFDDVLVHYPDSMKTPQLIYTLGSFYASVGDSLLSDSLFYYVYNNYNTELIANEAAKRIGEPLYEFQTDPGRDIFIEAEKKYDAGKFEEALLGYKKIYNNYKESAFAPKALLAASYIYREEIKDVDSVVAVYDSLSKNYPGTDYVRVITSKQNMYKQFVKAKQDSINRLLQDSLKLVMPDSTEAILSDSLKVPESDSLNIPFADSTFTVPQDSVRTDSTTKKIDKIITPADSVKKSADTKEKPTKKKRER